MSSKGNCRKHSFPWVFDEVSTYKQSGNVIFETDMVSPEAVKKIVRRNPARSIGF